MHASDWYRTIVEGVAGGNLPENTGYMYIPYKHVQLRPFRPVDGVNAWNAILDGDVSPRTEVVHQVPASRQNFHHVLLRCGILISTKA